MKFTCSELTTLYIDIQHNMRERLHHLSITVVPSVNKALDQIKSIRKLND